ncbi:MAG: nucleotide sugar dehydrogenase [bacterium]
MNVSIFGLGYVGTVMLGCLARAGHRVTGIDVQPDRVAQLNAGESPIVEPGLAELIAQGAAAGRIQATTEVALGESAISFVCVGTPSASDGSLDTSTVESVCAEIGQALARRTDPAAHCVVIRSTVMPGTLQRCSERLARASGSAPGDRFTLCANPEFLREGSAVKDFQDPPFTLVGAEDPAWAEPLRKLYDFLDSPFLVTGVGEAEILKTLSNAWHAAKVCFGNEVARLCRPQNIDPHRVMELFVQDARLNLSASYLRPGFAYGGSCLPKDVKAVGHLAESLHVELPLLQAVERSNRCHLERALEHIAESGSRRVGFLGLSFKPGTDDLRSSPHLDLVEYCLGKGLSVHIYDPCVQPARLVGANRHHVQERIGHIAELLVDSLDALVDHAELFVVGHRDPRFADLCRRLPADRKILDLVRAVEPDEVTAHYVGLSW